MGSAQALVLAPASQREVVVQKAVPADPYPQCRGGLGFFTSIIASSLFGKAYFINRLSGQCSGVSAPGKQNHTKLFMIGHFFRGCRKTARPPASVLTAQAIAHCHMHCPLQFGVRCKAFQAKHALGPLIRGDTVRLH